MDRCFSFNYIRDYWAPLIRWVSQTRLTKGKKIVATNGCFDVIHVGHLELLEKARAMGDFLVVGINSDWAVKQLKGSKRPINSQENRKRMLEALKCVDYVHIFDDVRATIFLKTVMPDIYVKSSDYSMATLDRLELAELVQAKSEVRFVPYMKGLSTSSILKKI